MSNDDVERSGNERLTKGEYKLDVEDTQLEEKLHLRWLVILKSCNEKSVELMNDDLKCLIKEG